MNNDTICTTCGTQFPADHQLPKLCPICNDDRQFIGINGQSWTNAGQLKKNHSVKITQINERLYTLKMEPDFAIGQQAFLVLSPNGNVLWDCITQLDEPTIDFIRSKGGLKAIAFSHPHFYTTMKEWAQVFDCPIYIHKNDEEYIFNKGRQVKLWEGEQIPLWDDMSIINVGGHFAGSSVLHIGSLTAGGTILCGDTLYISRSKRHTTVMYSYPNNIILSKKQFSAFYKRAITLKFDTMHGATFEGQSIYGNAYEIFKASMKRYLDSYGK